MVQMMERRMRPPATSAQRRNTAVVDLDPAPAASSADGPKRDEGSGEVKELRGQLTRLTEMVEKLTDEKKRRKDRGSRRRRRSRTRSRTRRGRARDVRNSSSGALSRAPKTPQRAPRSPPCPPPPRRWEQTPPNEEDDTQVVDKSWKVEKSWWQAYNERGTASDLAHVDARSLDPSKMTHEDLEWYVGDGFPGTTHIKIRPRGLERRIPVRIWRREPEWW